MQVLFMPSTMYALMWRLTSATNGQSIFKKTSPLLNRIGEQICSDNLTIYDNALDDILPGARAFDDEGVRTAKLEIIKDGILKNFYYDLEYAAKLHTTSTGHGYKSSMWGGDPTKIIPAPSLSNLYIEPGSASLQEMIASMDKGIILKGAMGAHSGNIPNGDYSVGVSPGIYVEKGRIVGRVKDAMVAGNIYETLKHVTAIENKSHPSWGGVFPAILCDNVSVSTK
jgi:PmbA protein